MNPSLAPEQLRALVERIERLEEEKKAISDDIKEVYGEAKGAGFDTKTLRKVVALRKLDSASREEQETMLELYMNALGMNRSDAPAGAETAGAQTASAETASAPAAGTPAASAPAASRESAQSNGEGDGEGAS